jgi:hypothetical protein
MPTWNTVWQNSEFGAISMPCNPQNIAAEAPHAAISQTF